jgi:hypothetical protein
LQLKTNAQIHYDYLLERQIRHQPDSALPVEQPGDHLAVRAKG